MLLQGDTEALQGLSVTPMCDRGKVVVSTNQLRFINFFLKVRSGVMLQIMHCRSGSEIQRMTCLMQALASSLAKPFAASSAHQGCTCADQHRAMRRSTVPNIINTHQV